METTGLLETTKSDSCLFFSDMVNQLFGSLVLYFSTSFLIYLCSFLIFLFVRRHKKDILNL